ncbi:hypothetical protein [Pleurocapsa sp. FMAR1]|uniref:hypothetical protein n=1 Tax=Pleurocapsa sp. FMAR1 TaxID=3040204 RepID=UPI0029C62979|nr:hypothetical protein [Pleurocapsa sp. FMAR1]
MNKAEIEAIVEAKIEAIFSRLFNYEIRSDVEFLPTKDAYRKLGYSSGKNLRTTVENGTFRLGIEVQDRRSPDSVYANYYFNIPACIKRLNTPPEKRA